MSSTATRPQNLGQLIAKIDEKIRTLPDEMAAAIDDLPVLWHELVLALFTDYGGGLRQRQRLAPSSLERALARQIAYLRGISGREPGDLRAALIADWSAGEHLRAIEVLSAVIILIQYGGSFPAIDAWRSHLDAWRSHN